jgi:hypothetical protein
MSKVALSSNALGTGTFTIASPNSNTDRTLTLPDNTGTILTTATPGVPVNGPAFRAHLGANQTVTTDVATKMQISVEAFDTANCFNTSTYRFTPNVAGYYQFTGNLYVQAGSTLVYNFPLIYKNGAQEAGAVYGPYSGASQIGTVSALVYLNGSTDYVELYGQASGTGAITFTASSSLSFFSGFLARSAT